MHLDTIAAVFALTATALAQAPPPDRTATAGPAPATAAVAPHELQAWTLQNGLPEGEIADLAQAEDGCLWLATFGGLVRFDGTSMTLFDLATYPGLRSSRIVSLLPRAKGGLWIGTEDQGLVCYRDGAFRNDGAASNVPHRTIWQLRQDRNGRLWGACDDGVWWVDGDRFGRVPDLHDAAHDLVELDDGTFWIATKHQLLHWHDAALTQIATGDFRCLLRAADGRIWTGTAGGRLACRTQQGVLVGTVEVDGAIDALAEDDTGGIWIAPGAPQRYAGARFEHLDMPAGTPRIRARAALLDREGNLWFGGNGLWRARPTPFTGLALPAGSELPRTVLVDARDRLWTALYDDRVLLRRNGAFVPIGRDAGLRGQSLANSRDGSLWVTSSHGLWRVADAGARIEAFARTLPPGLRRAILETTNGDLWIGCGASLVRLRRDSLVVATPTTADPVWTEGDGMPGGEVLALLESRPGQLWIGTVEGLAQIEGDRIVRTWRRGVELPGGEVRALCDAADGGLWVGTYGGGICHIRRDGTAAIIDTARGLDENIVSRIVPDGRGNLLLQGNRSLCILAESDLLQAADGSAAPLRLRCFRHGPGIHVYEGTGGHMPIAARSADGALWFPTIEGVVRFDPDGATELPKTAPVRIETVRVDGQPLATDLDLTGRTLDARPGQREVEIHFGTASFVQPEQVRFRYRLGGYRDDWVDAGARRVAIFTRVPPGEYDFAVQAANSDGGWSDATGHLQLRLLPFVHETLWFRTLLGLAALALGGLGVGLRARKIRRHALALEAEVRARTADLRNAHDQLEDKVAQRTRELAQALETMQSNMSRRELLETQLRESQKFEAVGRLAGGLAHDFNNMLTAVLGDAEHAMSLLDRAAPARASIAQIVDTNMRAAGLTRQLLAYSCQQVLKPEDIDPDQTIRALRGMLRRLVRESIDLQFVLAAGTTSVRVDPGQLEQVIINLVVNASDATPANGRITVATEVVMIDATDALREDAHPGRHVVIAVADTGAGIGEEIRDRVFDPFFTTKGPGKGTGLGLASVHGIVRQSGGHIRLQSEPGQGSTFRVYLPCVTPRAVTTTSTRQRPDASRTATILLCDDNPEVLRVTQRTLESAGHRVLAASSPQVALQLAAEAHAGLDLIITDLVMPEMNGRELAHRLTARRPQVGVLFLSGYSAEAVGNDGRADCDDLLQKPFTAQALTERVAEVLANRPTG